MNKLKDIKLNSLKISALLLLFVCLFHIGTPEVSAAKTIFQHTSIISHSGSDNSIYDFVFDFDMDDDDDISSEMDFVLPASSFIAQLNSNSSPTLLPVSFFLPFKGVPLHILNGLIRI